MDAADRNLDPLTDVQLMELGEVTRIVPGTRVLDLACGKGEMLCRWAQALGCSGVGVDLSAVFAAAARARAVELGVSHQIVIEDGDAGVYAPEPGSFDVACCVGATWIGCGVVGTIEVLRRAVTSSGVVLIGEPIEQRPQPQLLHAPRLPHARNGAATWRHNGDDATSAPSAAPTEVADPAGVRRGGRHARGERWSSHQPGPGRDN